MRVDRESKTQDLKDIPRINVIHVLDCSASMYNQYGMQGDKYYAAVDGINEELATLPSVMNNNFSFSLLEFGSSFRWVRRFSVDTKPLAKHDHMSNTALSSAIVEVLQNCDLTSGEKFLIKIFTDGGENHSPFFRHQEARELIDKFKKSDQTVTFVGTEGDVKRAIRMYNIDVSNTFVHDNTVRGVKMSAAASMDSNIAYSKAVASGQSVNKGFYKK